MLQHDPNPERWRRVHGAGGVFIGLAYIGPDTTQSAVEAEWRKRMPEETLMFRRIPSVNDDLHEQTPPLPFDLA